VPNPTLISRNDFRITLRPSFSPANSTRTCRTSSRRPHSRPSRQALKTSQSPHHKMHPSASKHPHTVRQLRSRISARPLAYLSKKESTKCPRGASIRSDTYIRSVPLSLHSNVWFGRSCFLADHPSVPRISTFRPRRLLLRLCRRREDCMTEIAATGKLGR
jgi:hypothetical protein